MEDRYISTELRRAVFERDGYTCQYCGCSGDDVRLEIDHIIPVSRGGVSDIRNLVTACEACNRSKSDKLISREALQELAERINSTAEYLKELITDGGCKVLDPNGEKRSEKVMLYLTPSLMDDLRDLAYMNRKSIADYVISLIERNNEQKQAKLALFRELQDSE